MHCFHVQYFHRCLIHQMVSASAPASLLFDFQVDLADTRLHVDLQRHI
jgi:hypothetical protein